MSLFPYLNGRHDNKSIFTLLLLAQRWQYKFLTWTEWNKQKL